MAISSRATTSSGAAAVNPVINVPAGVVNGDVLYLNALGSPGTSGFVVPTGWTELATASLANGGVLHVMRRVASSEPASYTLSTNAANYLSAMEALIGVDTTTPEDVTTPAVGTGSVATITFPSMTTATAGAWHLAIAADWATSAATTPTGYAAGGADANLTSSHKAISPAGVVSGVTCTDGAGTRSWLAASVAIRPAGTVLVDLMHRSQLQPLLVR